MGSRVRFPPYCFCRYRTNNVANEWNDRNIDEHDELARKHPLTSVTDKV